MLVNEDEYFRGQVEGDILYGVEGPPGPEGKSAYAYAKENGYTGSESYFSRLLGQFPERIDTAVQSAETAADAAYRAIDALGNTGISVVNTDSGEVISITDAAERPLMGMKVYGKTTQNGTPTPDAPVPLDSVGADGSVAVTVCGKNLFAEGAVYWGGLETSVARLALDYPATSPVTRPAWSGVGIRVPVLPNTTYTVSTDANPCNYFMLAFYKDMKDVGSASKKISYIEKQNTNVVTFTTPDECNCVVALTTSKTETEYSWTWWQVEHGSVATAYEPYKEAQTLSVSTPNGLPGIPVASGGNYTDESGQQWICDEVDFEKGVYVQRVANVTFNDATGWERAGASNGGSRFMNRNLSIPMQGATEPNAKANLLCSAFPTLTANETWYHNTGISGDHTMLLIYYDAIEQTTSALGAYFSSNPMTVVYQMAEPIATALSAEQLAAFAELHTNYPNTTVFNEEGAGMEVTYIADTKLYIDKKFDQLAAAMLNN